MESAKLAAPKLRQANCSTRHGAEMHAVTLMDAYPIIVDKYTGAFVSWKVNEVAPCKVTTRSH